MRIEADSDRQRTARFNGDLQALQTARFVGGLLSKHGLDSKAEFDRLAKAYKQPIAEAGSESRPPRMGEQKRPDNVIEGQFRPGVRQHPSEQLAHMQIFAASAKKPKR